MVIVDAGLECFDCNMFQTIWIIHPWIGITTLLITITAATLLYLIIKKEREIKK